MNTTALAKALKFACLPTLSLLILLFFAFFSISKTVDFISSDDGLAVCLRIVAFLGEVALVSIYYDRYLKEEILSGNAKEKKRKLIDSRTDLYELNTRWSSRDAYYMHKTPDSNIVYIERVEGAN